MKTGFLRVIRCGVAAFGLTLSAAEQRADDPGSWSARFLEADKAYAAGDYRAFSARMESLVREAEGFAPGDPRRAVAFHALGMAYYESGNPSVACRWLERAAREAAAQAAGPAQPEAITLNLLALTYIEIGQYSRAEKALLRSREILRDLPGRVTPAHFRVEMLSAKILLHRGRRKDAEDLARAAIARLRSASDSLLRQEEIFLWNLLGIMLFDAERWNEACEAYDRIAELSESLWGTHHANTAKARINLAAAHRKLGKPEEAEAMARESQQVLETLFGADHPAVAAALLERAESLKAMKQGREAKPLKKRAEIILARYVEENHLGATVDAGVLAVRGQ